jgi:outer membrane protein assembly factor BamB
MPSLDIHFADGRRDSRPLSRSSPVSIGAQTFNDICVPGGDVGPLHCRIGWSKTGYEVTAATTKGVDLNGTIVEHALLKPGDVLRIGTTDVVYQTDLPGATPDAKAVPDIISLKEKEPPTPKKEKLVAKASPPAADDGLSLFEGPVYAAPSKELPAMLGEPDQAVADSEDELPEPPSRSKGTPRPVASPGVVTRVGQEFQGARHRPGEQEILKSPLILGLGGGGIVLLLITATLYFLMGRESALRLYDRGFTDLVEGRYTQAIETLGKFVELYPHHSQTEQARINIGKARIQRELFGGAPDWSAAWKRLNEFVRDFRNVPAYRELRPIVLDYAEQVAVGAARTAEAARDRTLLPISQEATTLLERSADQDTPVDGILTKIRQATDKALAAIARQDARDDAVKVMQAAIAAGRMIDALSERDRLLRSYPTFDTDQGVQTVLSQALSQAQSTVTAQEPPPAPKLPAEPPAGLSILPVFHQRSRTEEASLGQTVWALAQDSCYALDTITGETIWRRVIGEEPAFAPVVTRGAQPGWLLFDRRRGELVHCRADNGKTLWRLALSAPPHGAPLVDQEQIYLATADRKLQRIDQETGELNAVLQFAQDIAGPPAINAARDHIFLAGSRGLVYALSVRPLACVAVTFTDHPDGAVVAPLVMLGRLLLVCQNDQPNRSTLKVFDAEEPTRPLPVVDVDDQSISGSVFDPPVLRGPQLVIPSQGERLTAFVVNDDPGRMGLTRVADYRVQSGYGGPIRVMLGPDDQFWMSSTAFRRFSIGTDSLRMETTTPVAVGLTSQPLQAVSELFFVARRSPFGEAVQMTNVDRDRMTGTWRTTLGARPKLLLGGENGPAVIVTDSGVVYSIGANRLSAGGIELRSGASLELPPTLADPLQIGPLGDGRGVIAAGGDAPQLWIVEANGRVGTPIKLSKPVERPPILLNAGLILPFRDRLQVRPLNGNAKYEDWLAPVDGQPVPAWAHVLRIDTDELLAADVEGRWRRLQLRGGDVPHLAEVVRREYPPPAAIAPVLVGESVLTVDLPHALRKLAARRLDEEAERDWPHAIRGLAGVDDETAVVWDDKQLRLVELKTGLPDRWSLPLNGLAPVGRPALKDGRAWLGCRDGTVMIVDLAQGQLAARVAVPQALSLGVVPIQNEPWAVAVDGTLYRLRDLPEARP